MIRLISFNQENKDNFKKAVYIYWQVLVKIMAKAKKV